MSPFAVLAPSLSEQSPAVMSLCYRDPYLFSGDAAGVISQWDLRLQKAVMSFNFNDDGSSMTEKKCNSILSIHVPSQRNDTLLAYTWHSRCGKVKAFKLTMINNCRDAMSIFECPASLFTLCPAAISDDLCVVPSVREDHLCVYSIDYSASCFNLLNVIGYGQERGTLFGLALNGSMLSACFEDGSIMLVKNVLRTGGALKQEFIKISSDPLTCLCFRPVKQQIIIGSTTNRMYKFNYAEKKLLSTVEYKTDKPGMTCTRVCEEEEGKLILTSCWDNSVRLFQSKGMKYLGCLSDRREKSGPVEFISAKGRKIIFAVGLDDGSIVIWKPYA